MGMRTLVLTLLHVQWQCCGAEIKDSLCLAARKK